MFSTRQQIYSSSPSTRQKILFERSREEYFLASLGVNSVEKMNLLARSNSILGVKQQALNK